MKKFYKYLLLLVVIFAFGCDNGETYEYDSSLNFDYLRTDYSGEGSETVESSVNYELFYKDDHSDMWDPMPFYDNGVYHIYYLAGGNLNLVDTTDFIHYENRGVMVDGSDPSQPDYYLGTGSVTKKGDDYYYFYTGMAADGRTQRVCVAVSEGNPYNFVKLTGVVFGPPPGWNTYEFRDPEVTYDEENDQFVMYMPGIQYSRPVIGKFIISSDLKDYRLDKIVHSDERDNFHYLECCDLFEFNGKWYLTYSVQDLSLGDMDTSKVSAQREGRTYYAVADSPDGPFEVTPNNYFDSYIFYASKTVSDGEKTYLVGWAKRKDTNIGYKYSWGGNLVAHEIYQTENGRLGTKMINSIENHFEVKDQSLLKSENYEVTSNTVSTVLDSADLTFMMKFKFKFDENVSNFGLRMCVGKTGTPANITFVPSRNRVKASLEEKYEFSDIAMKLTPGVEYEAKLVCEGSVVILYINDNIAFTNRIRLVGGRGIDFFSNSGTTTFTDVEYYVPGNYTSAMTSDVEILSGDSISTAVKLSNTLGYQKQSKNVSINGKALTLNGNVYYKYTAIQDSYVYTNLDIKSNKEVVAKLYLDGKEIESKTVVANQLSNINFNVVAKKGQQVVLGISSTEEASIVCDVEFGTLLKTSYFNNFDSINGTSNLEYTITKDGLYELRAIAAGASGNLVMTVNGKEIAFTPLINGSSNLKLSGIKYGVNLKAGDKIQLKSENNELLLTVNEGTREYLSSTASNLINDYKTGYDGMESFVTENVPVGESNSCNSSTLGSVQGNGSLYYQYGYYHSEMYNFEQKDSSGAYTNGSVSIDSNNIKVKDNMVVGVEWIAVKDEEIDIVSSFANTSGAEMVVQLYINNERITEKYIEAGGSFSYNVKSLDVERGDSVRLVVRIVSLMGDGEGSGKYIFQVK